jgi:hypothetical protein
VTIDAAVLRLGLVTRTRRQRRSLFDDPFFGGGSVTPKVFQTQPLTVSVQPLPPYHESIPYSGLVGTFDMTAEMENTMLKVGDSTTLIVTVEGQGNIMDAQAPRITLPDAFKVYTDAPQDDVALTADGYTGKKIFRSALVPVKAGDFDLPPVDIVYFDINQKAYRKLSVPLPTLRVGPSGPAPSGSSFVTPKSSKPEKQTVQFTGHDILPAKEELDALQPYWQLSWPAFLLWLVGPAIVYCGLVVFGHLRRQDIGPGTRMKVKARNALKSAKKAAGPISEDETIALLSNLYQALTSAIFSAARRDGEALTWKEVETLLIQCDMEPSEARQTAQLLSAIESAKFGGTRLSAEAVKRLLEQVDATVRRLAP